jgi:hypothetical protein
MQTSKNGQRTMFSIDECALRWGVSSFSVRRRADAGQIRTVFIGARRLISAEEVARVEAQGTNDRRQTRPSVADGKSPKRRRKAASAA